ncbi:hypothetical protein A1353_22575 [Methylomonas methanica]|uniref:Uncharacterized protein n=1 Tax=Methylomonas methanica TaxID=421 RepID=A0A177LWL1_METMH|nr:hypothetical protein [Methylomonas methanica]OAH97855.1 hypothetical protein A1353_22575 [Methylomonas methanica]
MRFALRVIRMQIGYPADLSARRPRYFRYENRPWFSPSGPAYRLFKFAPGEFVRGQKKVSKEKSTRMPLSSLDTSLCLALRVRCMQIGYPADLSVQKLLCSARQAGENPCAICRV